MTVDELIKLLAPSKKVIWGEIGNFKIKSISFNSRDKLKSSVFFAYKGESYNSNDDAAQMYTSNRADFVIAEKYLGEYIPHAVVPDGRAALAKSAEAFFGYPLNRYKSAAVTGTNGKTTTTYILDSIFRHQGLKTVRIGTTGIEIAGEKYATENTTPSSYDVYKYLMQGADKGCSFVSMEVSSHALAQGRLAGIKFDGAIFTNLTGDHLDFHKDMEHYFLAKAKLFDDAMSDYKIINTEYPYGKRLAGMVNKGLSTFSALGDADIFPIAYESGVFGIRGELSVFGEKIDFSSHLIGKYNLENIMGAVATAVTLGVKPKDAVRGMEELLNVPGRLEKYVKNGVAAFVDYAHTDDALKNAIAAIRPITAGRLITLFGAGGDRDKTKRPRMGKVVSELSDVIVITSDNPRTEEPDGIINDILAGIDNNNGKKIIVEPDREKAIEKAVSVAKDGDVLLLAGKGHEDYQVIGKTKYPFDDAKTVKKYLGII